MKLDKYNKKRNFEKTIEPRGNVKTKTRNRFVIQHHFARSEHYDFRLEWDGVLVSFAVPKGMPNAPNERRLAVHVEDHPIDYINFHGTIPKGNYGAGEVEIFDKGKYSPLNDFDTGLKKGHLKFILEGKKIIGEYNLIRTKEPNWIIIKSENVNFFEKNDKNNKKIKNPFSSCSVKLAMLSEKIPQNGYIYEIKYDGYRIVSYIAKDVILKTRNNIDYSNKLPTIIKSLSKLNKSMVLDGEVVVFDRHGKSDFSLLTESIKLQKNDIVYVIFDILALGGEDLRDKPLLERKKILEKELSSAPSNIIISSYLSDKGDECFEFAKQNNLEGIVAKKINSFYNSKRDEDWLKIKCYSRQEFVIGGYCTTEKNTILSAIYVGYYKHEEFIFIGKVGTGFNMETKRELSEKFKKIITNKNPFSNFEDKNAIWLKPNLVAEIQFAELTKSNILRQPSFIGLRLDKKPKDVVLEIKNEN